MKRRTWKQIVIPVPFSYHELLVASLTQLGCTGFLQEPAHLVCFMDKSRWSSGKALDLRHVLTRFRREFPGIDARFTLSDVREENWNARWEKSIGILEATDRIIVRPSWKRARRKDRGKIILQINPKMSFGTGHHESTRLSLRLLQRYVMAHSEVLDFGTGTGILALAAHKLGAQKVLAIDNDKWAIANVRENVRKNRATQSFKVVFGGIAQIPKERFHLAVANIDLPTISLSINRLVASLRTNGILILSGFLTSDLEPLLKLLKHRAVVPLELLHENEWIALALLKL
jgi:ribosomal protein L11 methyltransferase